MDKPRDKTDIVPIMLRVREDLRQHLAQSARARRVSLNQEIVDRLEYTWERRGLLREVLELTYGPSLGGLLMVLAIGLMGAGHREAARQAGWPLHDPEWLNNPVAFDAAAAVACGLLFAFRPRREAGDAELDREGQALASGMLASILESVRHAPDLPTEGPYSNPPPSHDAKIAHALLGPLVERLTDARLHQAFGVEIRFDQPEDAPGAEVPGKPTGAGSPGGRQRDDGEPDRERVGSNPVITLTHREFGPMRVRISDDVSWWARERLWNVAATSPDQKADDKGEVRVTHGTRQQVAKDDPSNLGPPTQTVRATQKVRVPRSSATGKLGPLTQDARRSSGTGKFKFRNPRRKVQKP